MYKVYILKNDSGKYYIGYTNNIDDRIERHINGRSAFTSQYKQWKLVYTEEYADKSEAIRREKYIKKQKSRKFIDNLINSGVEK